jgi:DnaK suppressor protein
MWRTREEIAKFLGVVPNSIRGKVQKGQIERKVEDGKNVYRLVAESEAAETAAPPETPERVALPQSPPPIEPPRPLAPPKVSTTAFNPKQVLMEQLASMKVERSIAAIEKGDEIDLATGEISRELDAKISMRHYKQIKEIEEALERIKLGEYGTCEDCGEPVPEQRLRLFPAARLCVRCQEEYDHYEKMRDSQNLRGGVWREESTEGSFARSFEE